MQEASVGGIRPRHGAKLPPPTSAGGLPKGSLPTSMEGEPSTDVVFGGFSDKVPPFALKKKTALPAKNGRCVLSARWVKYFPSSSYLFILYSL